MGERYRREGEMRLIDIKLNSIQQLFNSLDPSPFHEKDLDADAEDYIVGAAREFATQAPLKLVLHLPADHAAQPETAGLAEAIHNYFAYRRDMTLRDLRFQLHLGRHSLAIGLVFLFVCMGLRQLFFVPSDTTLEHIFAEGLLISGWVSMWRPIQTFLYDWWPLRRMARVYDKLTRIPVDVREAG